MMCLEKGAKNKFVECLQKGVRSGIHGVVSKKGKRVSMVLWL